VVTKKGGLVKGPLQTGSLQYLVSIGLALNR